ncbi:MAG: hypothetical protein COU82_01985, partial [Candidatus Portnoybacteria bacterium CG10_big_fil_rev_8_21_14_0_10_38_18]
MKNLIKFEKFLQSVDLNAYRDKYKSIKIVEMDLPKEIQAIPLLYKVYWDEQRFLNYDEFYKEYFGKYRREITVFQRRTGMCPKCFKKG